MSPKTGFPNVAEAIPPPDPEAPWPDRSPLPPETEPVPTLEDEMLPEPLRKWLGDTAERMSVPLEFVAAPALVGLGSVVGRACAIRPMARDDWREVPNVWGGIIADPGLMKTAAIAEGTRPIQRLAHDAARAFEAAQAGREAASEVIEARRAAVRDEMKKAAKVGNAAELCKRRRELEELSTEEAQAETTERRFVTSDATIEKLGALLNENPRGLLLLRDELTGWLRSLDREDRADSRAFFLESWNGTGSFTVDRIGRGTVRVEALCVSVLGGIQPGRLRPYVLGAVAGEEQADGLMQRFGLMVWPDSFGEWRAVDRWPNHDARNRAFAVFERLAALEPQTVGAELENDGLPFFRYAPEAQALFLEWRHELERRLRSDELARTPAFCSHLAKYRKLVPSLSLVFHLADLVDGVSVGAVGARPLRLALAWAEFLELHARKVYAPELRPKVAAARALAERLEAGSVVDGSTVRDLARREWGGLRTAARVWQAVEELERLGWLRVASVPSSDPEGRGRPSDVLRLHPDFRGAK